MQPESNCIQDHWVNNGDSCGGDNDDKGGDRDSGGDSDSGDANKSNSTPSSTSTC